MRNNVFYIIMIILVGTLVLIMIFGDDPEFAGMTPGQFADTAKLSVIGLLVATCIFGAGSAIHPRLWHVAAWLALLVALVIGYRLMHPEEAHAPAEAIEAVSLEQTLPSEQA